MNDFDPSEALSQTSLSRIFLLTPSVSILLLIFNLKVSTFSEYSISSSVVFLRLIDRVTWR